jgi:hypothetical protein
MTPLLLQSLLIKFKLLFWLRESIHSESKTPHCCTDTSPMLTFTFQLSDWLGSPVVLVQWPIQDSDAARVKESSILGVWIGCTITPLE